MKFTSCLTALGENTYYKLLKKNITDRLIREIDKVVPFFKNMDSHNKFLFALSSEDSYITTKIAIFIDNMNKERESALTL